MPGPMGGPHKQGAPTGKAKNFKQTTKKLMCHKTNKAQEWVRVWNVQTRKGRGSLDALWEKKK